MKPVRQTRFRGPDAPEEEQGDCFQAALASILEIALEDSFDAIGTSDDDFNEHLTGWLGARYRLQPITLGPELMGTEYEYLGHYILCVRQPSGVTHSVVAKDGEIVHDPMRDTPDGDYSDRLWIMALARVL